MKHLTLFISFPFAVCPHLRKHTHASALFNTTKPEYCFQPLSAFVFISAVLVEKVELVNRYFRNLFEQLIRISGDVVTCPNHDNCKLGSRRMWSEGIQSCGYSVLVSLHSNIAAQANINDNVINHRLVD
ncbi:hypothetical protein CDAR_410241 [Caerostris darwini]|uniref:Secreted protein n=1 Tax=Caerostris darwini TaxID=1538125 RepID=A0AAV4RAU6_9ARAC|nr:hypothetical protein CDAR_410241 [Caerostris darwini]